MSSIAVELAVLLGLQTMGTSIFARFEAETPVWRKLTKWSVLILGTLALSAWLGHWSLLFPAAIFAVGTTVHFSYCRKHGIDPLRTTPRRRYYELRDGSGPSSYD